MEGALRVLGTASLDDASILFCTSVTRGSHQSRDPDIWGARSFLFTLILTCGVQTAPGIHIQPPAVWLGLRDE